jgi:hypothetical protein
MLDIVWEKSWKMLQLWNGSYALEMKETINFQNTLLVMNNEHKFLLEVCFEHIHQNPLILCNWLIEEFKNLKGIAILSFKNLKCFAILSLLCSNDIDEDKVLILSYFNKVSHIWSKEYFLHKYHIFKYNLSLTWWIFHAFHNIVLGVLHHLKP